MRRTLTVLLLLLGNATSAYAFTPDLAHLDGLPLHVLPPVVVSRAVAAAQSKYQPYQFAVSVALPLGVGDGLWQMLDDGSWSWRTRIYSAGAQTLNLHFKQLALPPGAALWLYDAAGQRIEGPYTETQIGKDGQLWTPVVPGDTAVIEIRASAVAKNRVQLQLAEVNHGFRGFGKAGNNNLSGFNQSGACEINAACPSVSAWATPANAVGRISIGGQFLCSGSLVNNVRRDNTPYFLTAHHCEVPTYGAGSVVFYWDYQFANCNGSSTEPGYETNSGSTLVADDQGTDFTLVRLNAPPTGHAPYLDGWDASSSDVPSSGAVIHHPLGDVKKTSLFGNGEATRQPPGNQLCDSNNNCVTLQGVWQVFYTLGVTEEGSSGSALLNQNQQVIGQLSGGGSACNGSSGNGMSDIYSRTDQGWTANAASSGQLKAWLDPGNTGTLAIAGQAYGASGSSSGGSSSSSSSSSSGGSSSSGSSSSGGSSSGHGGAMPVSVLAGLALIAAMRRRHPRVN